MTNFDEIGDYDSEIPPHVHRYYLAKKMSVMVGAIRSRLGERSLRVADLGCGTGDYVAALSDSLGGSFVVGVDFSRRQLEHARRKYPGAALSVADMSAVPFRDGSFDVVCATNSIHHLPTRAAQLQAIRSAGQLLRPGGLFIVNEMNVFNPLILFYLRFIFAKRRAIDEGDEIWLDRALMTEGNRFEVVHEKFYTFVPDFSPPWFLRLMKPLDRWLDATVLARFGAHMTIIARRTA